MLSILVFVANNILNYLFIKYRKTLKTWKTRSIVTTVLIALVIQLNVWAFQYIQSNNHFRFMQVSRLHQPQDLKKSYRKLLILLHPDKNSHQKDDFIKLKQIFGYLQNPRNREQHDRYGITYENKKIVNAELHTYILEATIVYAFYLVVVVLQLDYFLKEVYLMADLKVAVFSVVLSFYGLELYYLSKQSKIVGDDRLSDQMDMIDRMFSQASIYERTQFLRICSGPITSLIIASMHHFYPDLVQKNIQILDDLMDTQKRIQQDSKINQVQRDQLKKQNLAKVNSLSNDIYQMMNERKKSIEMPDKKNERRKKRLVKLIQVVSYLGVFAYLLYLFQLV